MTLQHNPQTHISHTHLKRSLSCNILTDHHALRYKYTFPKDFSEIRPLKKQKPSPEEFKSWSHEQYTNNTFPNTHKKKGLYLYICDNHNRVILGRSHTEQNGNIQPNPTQEDIAEKHNDIFPKNNPHITKCAGEKIFESNPLPTYVNNKSGHFRPSAKAFIKFIRHLYLKGLISSATNIEILEKSPLSKEQEDKTFSQKGAAHRILNMPFQDWHYSPFRKKPFDE